MVVSGEWPGAASGLGLIQVAEFYASQMIATGQLVKVLESSRAKGYDISVVFPQLKKRPPKTSRLD